MDHIIIVDLVFVFRVHTKSTDVEPGIELLLGYNLVSLDPRQNASIENPNTSHALSSTLSCVLASQHTNS